MLTSAYDQRQSKKAVQRIALARRHMLSMKFGLPGAEAPEWDAVEADQEVQMWLRQLSRADNKVREIEANVDDYVDLLDAFDPHLVGRHYADRKNKALEQFAYKPRAVLWERVIKAIRKSHDQHYRKGEAA